MNRAEACLRVDQLRVNLGAARGVAVRDVSLHVDASECVGIVGESGSGKTLTCLAIMGLTPRGVSVSGELTFSGLHLGEPSVARAIRGDRICMVFQDPLGALTPHVKVGVQLTEGLVHRHALDTAAARERAELMLASMRIDQPASRMRQYPHELSGGMRQRVLIAMACLMKPELLIADEPTTALDASIRNDVLALMQIQRDALGSAMLLVTHDLAVLERTADRLYVMYAGRVVESGPAKEFFRGPLHPYAAALLACSGGVLLNAQGQFATIEGRPPTPFVTPSGCAFAPRCAHARARCESEPPALLEISPGRWAACHFPLSA